MIHKENYRIDRMRRYEIEYPFDLENARRAWRVAFTFDQIELFDSVLMRAISNQSVADWSCIFNLSEDVDIASISEFRKCWPDSSYIRALGES